MTQMHGPCLPIIVFFSSSSRKTQTKHIFESKRTEKMVNQHLRRTRAFLIILAITAVLLKYETSAPLAVPLPLAPTFSNQNVSSSSPLSTQPEAPPRDHRRRLAGHSLDCNAHNASCVYLDPSYFFGTSGPGHPYLDYVLSYAGIPSNATQTEF